VVLVAALPAVRVPVAAVLAADFVAALAALVADIIITTTMVTTMADGRTWPSAPASSAQDSLLRPSLMPFGLTPSRLSCKTRLWS